MRLQQRERITIGLGLALVLVVLAVRFTPTWGEGASEPGSIADSIARLKRYSRLEAGVATLSKSLSVTPPTVAYEEQEAMIRQEIDKLAGQCKVQVGGVRRLDAPRRLRRAGSEDETLIRFRLDVKGEYDKFMAYMYALEHSALGMRVDQIRIDAEMPQGQGNQAKPQGKIEGTMTVRGYLFPKVFLPEDAQGVEIKDVGGVAEAPKEEATPPPAEVKEEAKPTTETEAVEAAPEATATPEPEASGPRRIRIRLQGHEILIVGNTVHVNGQTQEIPEGELDKALEEAKKQGAEIIYE